MNVTLKNIKTTATGAFSATIYVDDAPAGQVSNGGNGGPNMYAWKNAAVGQKLQEFAAATYPQYKFEQLDHLIACELDRDLTKKKLAKYCKKETLFRIPGEAKPGEWRSLRNAYSPAIAAILRGKYPTVIIANEDLDAAVKNWTAADA